MTRPGNRLARRRPAVRRVLAWTAVLAGGAVLAFGTGLVVDLRVQAAPAASSAFVEIHSAHGASFVPALTGKRALFILTLGSDARPAQRIDGERTDSIHIVGIDPRRRRATILGFPRDSWVNIPGFGMGKINDAMALGGPGLAVRTIEALTGIRIDFWMLVSFGSFSRIVDGIGGLAVDVPRPMHDRYSHANLSPGAHRLKGWQALAFARDRHDVPGGDIGRSLNQGRLFLAALSQFQRTFRRDPNVLLTWVAVGWRNVRSNLSVHTLVDLAITASQVPLRGVNNLVIPTSAGTIGGASIQLVSPAARSIFADMRKDGVARRP